MNAWLTQTALRTRGLSPGARIVLLAHADACRPSGRTCLAGLEELAEACELSPKHVMRLRAQLVTAGHLRKLAAARPGQRPVYEVLPQVPIPLPSCSERSPEPDRVARAGRTAAGNESHDCDPPYKPQGITPPTPPTTCSADPITDQGGKGIFAKPTVDNLRGPIDPASTSPSDANVLASAAIAALRPDQRARVDELGRRRLERAAHPLVAGWSAADLATRMAAERVDRAENLAAVLAAILRRYALEPAPRELRAAERAHRSQPPPPPCAHGDPSGCTACSFCRRGLADPGGERCDRCVPSSVSSTIPMPKAVNP